ncbi:proton-translocating NADH-quinone oxidoreductase, chain L [Pirellula staleyi DSM 6068]|uniref:Proton-translocating NADH-quinone oxidoreductase, chain L n=1 Tax=Pirellula staleyi (strain ATCC 27377 / DSM 6068 / ICPB 4128) TaxID=530564 RepID=D2R5F9_PIRSD|nr:proton-conducting transporter membrane subunit [Pirellula staleyi]ADB15418.1 proton-translocating NADH-quinone oxidoreductase, chain L [Pirellula staleyi DSM 6068]
MGDTLSTALVLIPALPLAAAILVGLLGARVLKGYSHLPVIFAIVGSFIASVVLLGEVYKGQQAAAEEAAYVAVRDPAADESVPVVAPFERVVTLWTWANVPAAGAQKDAADFRIDVALRADGLTAMMLAMVTFVASLVAVFGSGYMHGDRGYWRFFAYVGLFVFSMTMLVSVSNFVLLFCFWEAVGACSYLLIGFWYTKPEAAAAGKKAFLVNRVGDFGFSLAIFLIWCTYGTLNFHDTLSTGATDPAAIESVAVIESLPAAAREQEIVKWSQDPKLTALAGVETFSSAGEASASDAKPTLPKIVAGVLGKTRLSTGDYVTGGLATAICLLLLLGACGKSAQLPLHVWLPDAMEGPTPVSALIHAATMVTAGVYMVTRCTPLFMASPTAQVTVAIVGGSTALLAGLIALTQYDLKRVLAYSTVSQLGYMFLALGAGTYAGITGGMFHLFTHAFFKALLFLGAGSVMHAMGNIIDMRQFGGLRKLMPYTHATFLLGCLALAGVFPFAGFWSKDAVLASVHDKMHMIDHEIEHRAEHAASHAAEKHAAGHAHGHASGAVVELTHASPVAEWSDAQLASHRTIYSTLYYLALFTAFLTAFYTFRAFCMTFYGEEKIPHQAGHHAHESPPIMTAPLVVLSVAAVVIGAAWISLTSDWGANSLLDFIGTTPSLAVGAVAATREVGKFHIDVAGVSTVTAGLGILLACYLYLGSRTEVAFLKRIFDLEGLQQLTDPQWVMALEKNKYIGLVTGGLRKVGLGFVVTTIGYLLAIVSLVLAAPLLLGSFVTPYKLSLGKFYIDELYSVTIVWPMRIFSMICYWLDRNLIDGLVNLFGAIPPAIGSLMRSLQMGLVQFYALAMVLGAMILIAARMLWAAG